MKLYKNILTGVMLSLSAVGCDFNGDGGNVYTPTPLPQPCVGDACKTDLETTPEKVTYFDGGWYGPSPNYRLEMELTRTGGQVSAKVKTPSCSITADVLAADYIKLDDVSSGVPVKIETITMVDGGDEILKVTESGKLFELHLKLGDSSTGKPVVRDSADAVAIRNQINLIADKALSKCPAAVAINKLWLRENVSDAGAVDHRMLIPNPRFEIKIQDIRVTHEAAGTRIQGYRTIVQMDKTCQVQVNSVIVNNASWKTATKKVSIERTDVICMRAPGAEHEDDMRVLFPQNPKKLSLYYTSGKIEHGFFGCENRDQVRNSSDFETLVSNFLNAKQATCISNISRPYSGN